jgi:uncharacterized protein (TIGR02145 family)
MKNLSVLILIMMLLLFSTCEKESHEGSVTDFDGNVYRTVKIGNQWWMAENLRTTSLNDGQPISCVTDGDAWGMPSTIQPAYCWYYNDSASYKNTYGALYNWHAVNSKKLCPINWHVPSDSEWTSLVKFLGGSNVAGGKLKEAGTLYWGRFNNATNETGFTALPGGRRYINFGAFLDAGKYGFWWSSTEFDATDASNRFISSDIYIAESFGEKGIGYSVRCVKD